MKNSFKYIGVGALFLVLGVSLGRHFSRDAAAVSPQLVDQKEEPEELAVWTCSMHPQIQQPDEGDCPICGMDLIPLVENAGGRENPRGIALSETALALANIKTTKVERAFPEKEVRLSGKLVADETRVRSLTARFSGRIERLYVNYDGISVKENEHLAEIYSPELLAVQKELLSPGPIANAAQEKLRLWGFSSEQVKDLDMQGTIQDTVEIRSPITGVVVEKRIHEGDYVETGKLMFRIADLNQLWLELEAFESDLVWLRYGQLVEFSVAAFSQERFDGRIVFIAPTVDLETRTVSVRVQVDNESGRLKPGMFAKANIRAQASGTEGNFDQSLIGKWISPMHPEIIKDAPGQCDVCGMDLVPVEDWAGTAGKTSEAPLVLPTSAVLVTGKRALVYVQTSEEGSLNFEAREVILGPKAGAVYIVEDGLEVGEEVVTQGAFKIDSELQIQAKPSLMSMVAGKPEYLFSKDDAHLLIDPYFQLQKALAQDEYPQAFAIIEKIEAIVADRPGVREVLSGLLNATSIVDVRRPHFEIFSDAMIKAVKANRDAFERPIWHMTCPMVYDDRGADWLQEREELFNPYWGDEMLLCGEILGQINQSEPGIEASEKESDLQGEHSHEH